MPACTKIRMQILSQKKLQPYGFFCISTETEYGNGAYSYSERSYKNYSYLCVIHLINLQWHPASYFAPPAATSACIICMHGGGGALRRGGAARVL